MTTKLYYLSRAIRTKHMGGSDISEDIEWAAGMVFKGDADWTDEELVSRVKAYIVMEYEEMGETVNEWDISIGVYETDPVDLTKITSAGYMLVKLSEVKAVVYLYPGAGYTLVPFYVGTDVLEAALEDVLAYCQKKGLTGFYSNDEECENDQDRWIYIDPTFDHHDANPAYLYIMEMKFDVL